MLNLLLGRAGTGKTLHIMDEIKRRMDAGETGMLLIVPEQYSHDAERQLCAVCGDRLSLHAEVLSFSRLCTHVLSETGGAAKQSLDASGQILAMHRALESVSTHLKVYGIKRMRTEILERLLEAVKEFKTLRITPQALENAAELTSNPLSDKLRDLALIYDAYDALLHVHGGDAAERLTMLADSIGESSVGDTGHIYFDGFIDFTALELAVIEELMQKHADITVCLTCDPNDPGEIFEIPRKTITTLTRLAHKNNVETIAHVPEPDTTGCGFSFYVSGQNTTVADSSPTLEQKIKKHALPGHAPAVAHNNAPNNTPRNAPELIHLEKHLFDDAPPPYTEPCNAISIYSSPTRYTECEYAAYEVWKLIRNAGYRWRDIAVMARDWDEYGSICENVFEKYGIPFFTSGKADILSKPPLTLIDAALEIATLGFEYKSVFRYLKSGLIDITTEQCSILENYVLKWQIRGSLWTREWTMPPSGYGRAKDEDEALLTQVNTLRSQIIKPLLDLRDGIKGETTTEIKLRALYSFLEEIELPESLTKKSAEFSERGEMRLADEYTQLWDITVSAMDQMYTILGSDILSAIEFRKLLTLALSQNDVGVIPISLDRTALGGMAMSRRRDIKCLIILGATDENLPTLGKGSGALSDNERTQLSKLGTEIPAGLEERLYREMNMLYSTLTLPSQKLILMYSKSGGKRPSFIIKRLCEMYSLKEETLSEDEYMTAAEIPYRELLYSMGLTDSGIYDESMINTRQNQRLSARAAEQLYGKSLLLSATRADMYYSCPYKHFLQNGLRLEPRTPAEFDALAAGNFMHFVLDGVFTEIKEGAGFKNVKEETYLELTKKYIDKFVTEELYDFEGKTARFVYLFRRNQADVVHVVRDMIQELGKSDFEPRDLELNMSELSSGGEVGFIDRVDGYEHKGKLYLRVIDYKTRKKAYSFELTDIIHGRDMQMLIYLFALQKFGHLHYDKEIEAAGVLYVPARDVILRAPRNASDEDIQNQRIGEMRRSGLILNDPAVLEAMENSDVKEYLPVKTAKDGSISGDSLVSSKQITLLSEHVSTMMQNAKEQIQRGNTECSPYYKSESDNACTYCEFHSVCGFNEELGDKHRFVSKMTSEEVWESLEKQDE